MSEGKSTEALDTEPQPLVTCLECSREADADEAQRWSYVATGPGAIYRFCPECADLWRPAGAPVNTRNDDFELSWLTAPLIVCSKCGTEIEEEEAQAARWAYWSDETREFHPFCAGCAKRIFGHRYAGSRPHPRHP